MGSTIGLYMLRIWDENVSLAICVVDGKTTLARYIMGRREDDNENLSSDLYQWMLIFISAPILKGKLRFISALIWKGGVYRLRRRPQILNKQ